MKSLIFRLVISHFILQVKDDLILILYHSIMIALGVKGILINADSSTSIQSIEFLLSKDSFYIEKLNISTSFGSKLLNSNIQKVQN